MKTRGAALAIGLLCLWTAVMPAQRLPQTAIPEHYDIHLTPDFSTDTFQGQISIAVQLGQPTSAITLNAVDLEFLEATITAGGVAQTAAVSLDSDRETATLSVAQPVPAGPAAINIRFSGKLNKQLRGFYLSQANNRKYALTQMEPTDARRAFPCFDEPALKATFAVTVTADSRDSVISNGRIISDTPGPGPGKHTVTFSTSSKMSSYLVAVLVGDWVCANGGADGIPIRVCATPNRRDELGFGLQAAEFAMRYFNRYFTMKYPFEKLDIIGVPDFSAGAMENAGAIVFREQLLLVDERTASTANRKQVAEYINHEMAHQWFGDLVTMAWWDDIWLNEGFATWMEHKPTDEWHPEWNPKLDEVRDTQAAMNLDALESTRPIRTRVDTPAEINQVFDAISYQKTGAVVRMIEGFIGADAYRAGINAYVTKFAYGSATGEGYWATIAASSGKPVDRILSSYITQAGMPLVSVSTSCVGGKMQIELSQRPMSSAGPASTAWDVPVCYKRSRNGKVEAPACEVLSNPSQTLTLDGCSPWVFANADSLGYYRTSYDPKDLEALGEALQTAALSPREQTSLLEDVWALVRSDRQNIADFLSLSNQLVHAPLGPAISTAASRINYISDHFIDPAERPAFEHWVRTWLTPLADRLGYTPLPQDSDERRGIRASVLYTLGYAGRDPEVLSQATRQVDMQLANVAAIDPSLTSTYVQLAAINGDAALYEKYLEQVKRSNAQSRQLQYRGALAFFSDPALRKRTFDYATSSKARTQDVSQMIGGLLARPWASHDTWNDVKTNWEALETSLAPLVFQGLPALVGSTNNFCDAATRDDIEQFFDDHHVRGIDRPLRRSLDAIDRCIQTKNSQGKSLSASLTR